MILLVTVTGWEGTSQVILSIEEMLLNTWDVKDLVNNGIKDKLPYQLVQDFFHQQY